MKLQSIGYEALIRKFNLEVIPNWHSSFIGLASHTHSMCHFRQQAIITRYLTKKPKMKASQDLKRICSYLGKVEEKRFEFLLKCWYKKHEEFINEKTYNEETKRWHYTHKRLRSAYRSLKTNLPYLFTYKNYPELNIPNTTNHLDGELFAPMKMLMKIHRGIGVDMKKKIGHRLFAK